MTVTLLSAWHDALDSTDYGGAPGGNWSNASHLSAAGYTAWSEAIAAGMPAPASDATIVMLGDSWGLTRETGLKSAIDTAHGTDVTVLNESVGGDDLWQMLDRWDDVLAHTPDVVVHYSGFANDIYSDNGTAALRADIEELLAKCEAAGADLVMPGAAPMYDHRTRSEVYYHAVRYAVWGV